jgi:XTP/dITP diphosphohydrolase
MASSIWKLNTSNLNKFEEFKRLFAQYGCRLEVTHEDLKEIDADPLTVIAHKASQVEENVLVEDTSLEVEGASIGIHVRWLLEHLSEYMDRQAHWKVLLAYRRGNKVCVYKGSISGTIVEPRGASDFGFDSIFLPNGAAETLAESKPDQFNARAKAVEALMQNKVWMTSPVITEWEGPWQRS